MRVAGRILIVANDHPVIVEVRRHRPRRSRNVELGIDSGLINEAVERGLVGAPVRSHDDIVVIDAVGNGAIRTGNLEGNMGVGTPLPESERVPGSLPILAHQHTAVIHVVGKRSTGTGKGDSGEVGVLQSEAKRAGVAESRASDQSGFIDASQQRLSDSLGRKINEGEVGAHQDKATGVVQFADDHTGSVESPRLQIGGTCGNRQCDHLGPRHSKSAEIAAVWVRRIAKDRPGVGDGDRAHVGAARNFEWLSQDAAGELGGIHREHRGQGCDEFWESVHDGIERGWELLGARNAKETNREAFSHWHRKALNGVGGAELGNQLPNEEVR